MPKKPFYNYRTLILLLLAYGLAAWLPGPGNWLRSLRIDPWNLSPDFQVQHGMLAIMLLCAGLGSTRSGLRETVQNSGRFFSFTLVSCLLPALAGILIAVALGWLPGIPIEVRLAVLIVAAMPVANSTAGWASQLKANIPLSLAVLMAATTLSPLITAPLINLGIYLTGLQKNGVNALPAWGNDMSMFFALWVFAPIILGVLISQFALIAQLERLRRITVHFSLLMLLLLNYVNGTVCLPGLVAEPGQFVEPLLAAGLLISLTIGLLTLRKIIRSTYADKNSSENPADEISLLLAVVMRNTGAAMVYTSTVLASVPLVSLVVLFYTVMQHLYVGTVAGLPSPEIAATSDKVTKEADKFDMRNQDVTQSVTSNSQIA